MTDFPGITKQAKWIAKLYKFFGLWSIPILTIATTISIANVFMHGQLASDTRLQFAWAVLFAAAIEVNIVRLFFEAKLDKDHGAFVLGIVLAIVAGAALLIEGLQQSIGFDWSNILVQWTVGIVVAARVIVVVWLLAREGSRLASSMIDTAQPLTQIDTPAQPELIQELVQEEVQDTDTKLHIVPAQKKHTVTPAQLRKMRTLLTTDPRIPVRTLADKVGVSPGTAQKYKNSIAKEA
jgi:hypothetical protein